MTISSDAPPLSSTTSKLCHIIKPHVWRGGGTPLEGRGDTSEGEGGQGNGGGGGGVPLEGRWGTPLYETLHGVANEVSRAAEAATPNTCARLTLLPRATLLKACSWD